jgi:hypothetical protein
MIDATLDEVVRPATAARSIHMTPPVSVRLVVLASPRRVYTLLGAFAALAIAAHFDGGRLLLFVDQPVEKSLTADTNRRLRGCLDEATLDRVQGKVIRTVDGPAVSPTTMAR